MKVLCNLKLPLLFNNCNLSKMKVLFYLQLSFLFNNCYLTKMKVLFYLQLSFFINNFYLSKMKVLFYLQLSFLFRQFELISSECRHARLDAAGAESNQGQADQWKLTTDKNKHLKGTNISLIIAWRDCIEEPYQVNKHSKKSKENRRREKKIFRKKSYCYSERNWVFEQNIYRIFQCLIFKSQSYSREIKETLAECQSILGDLSVQLRF